MVSKPGLRHWAVMVLGLGLMGSCTTILGIDTEYFPNPCTDGSIEPQQCGQGACHVFLDKDERCLNGLPTDCVEGTSGGQEVCKDGIDNNCDGNVDEMCPCDEGQTQRCYNGSTDEWSFGVCMLRGSQICTNGAWSICDSDVLPTTEICNDGKDNDCDGNVDENCTCTPGVPPKPCYGGPDDSEGIGVCRTGTQKCKADGTWGECDGDVVPGTETWNGADDDCDGQTDNGFVCAKGTKQGCYDGVGGVDSDELKPKGGVTPECKAGEQECIEGKWGPCLGQKKPEDEFCDGLDNDCNGKADDGSFNVPELCNGKDDNCNLLVDEGNPGGGEVCNTGKPGPCKDGVTQCTSGGVECQQNIQATTEICDGLDNDCNGAIDDGDPEGGAPCSAPDAVGACINGKTKCQTGKLVCIPAAPTTETCNGIDDNCDNIIDNGNPGSGQPCAVAGQQGVCANGTTDCVGGGPVCKQVVTPTAEICDSKDNDCNGATDDNVPGTGGPCTVSGLQGECAKGALACQNGLLTCIQVAQPVAEVCDGLDNNCNGGVDEGNPGGGATCNVMGQLGVCAVGVVNCSSGALSCSQTNFPSPELCDGQDNNCSGQADEGNPGGNVPCNTGNPGLCAAGVFNCISGTAVCSQTTTPNPETCDGFDNDCDGQIDEGNPGGGGPCTVPNAFGECAKGSLACQNGVLTCAQVITPQPETCDGLDNNCNGAVDEMNPGGGQACSTGKFGVCAAGTSACAGGTIVCNQNTQPSSEQCDNLDNNCNGQTDEGSPGGGIACPTGQPGVCSAGTTACSNGAIVCNQNQQPAQEICNGLDDNCNGTADEGNPGAGQTCNTGKLGVCTAGTTTCTNGSVVCTQNIPSGAEECDGLDNDCDGAIDEGNPGGGQMCNTGQLGACSAGTTNCSAGSIVCAQNTQPSSETCDNLDNNCNGTVDEGNPGSGQTCNTGQLGVCSAGTTTCTAGSIVCNQNTASSNEICDNKDNDCDGVVDDNPATVGDVCTTGLPGVCSAGTKVCTSGVISCSQTTQASTETCDNFDNDCNGVVDNGNPGGGLACSTGNLGVCAAGTTACTAGSIACNQNTVSSAEICDGLDNDCNGTVDNGNPGSGQSCNTGNPGICSAGTTTCTAGALVCNQNSMATTETCNGLDDDCNGTVDNGNPGGGTACMTGQLGVCSAGTTSCTAGSVVCNQNTVSSTETCDNLDNDCDGTVDNGNPGGGIVCSTGNLGICAAGTTACTAGVIACNQDSMATTESCNGLDDDCDGTSDNGNPGGGAACMTGQQGVCSAGTEMCTGGTIVCAPDTMSSTETCDGLDNDCNGTVDNGDPGGGVSCSTGNPGVCDAGTTACTSGAIVCNQTLMASAEICNGLDDDCNGTADDGDPGGGAACTVGGQQGACADGSTICMGGSVQCEQTTFAVTETCNGFDDNCDGDIDIGPFCCNTDVILSGDETDINCGGSCAQKCADASIECTMNAQCGTSTCNTGIGKCVAQTCSVNGDCISGKCTAGTCVAATCTDGVKDGVEGDVDCGGACPAKCALAATCIINTDCESGNCSGGICSAPACNDTSMNGNESDVDCGGSCATKCSDGKACIGNLDCTSNTCDRGLCVPTTCQDTMMNGNETAVDCGGSDCQICPTLLTLVTSGSAPSTIQRATFNGTAWTGISSLATSSVVGTPSLDISSTRYAIGVVRSGLVGNVDTLQFTRWIGTTGGWALLSALPNSPKADGAPVVRAIGPFVGAAFRHAGNNGAYHTARYYGFAWQPLIQATGAPSNATIYDLDWIFRDGPPNAALVYPEQASNDIFFQFRTNGSWNTAATTATVTADKNIQPNIVRLSNGDLLMTFVQSDDKIAFSRYNGTTWSTPVVVDDSGTRTVTTIRPALVAMSGGRALLAYSNSTQTNKLYDSLYNGTSWSATAAVTAGGINSIALAPGLAPYEAEAVFSEGGTFKHARRNASNGWDFFNTNGIVSGINANVQNIAAASFR